MRLQNAHCWLAALLAVGGCSSHQPPATLSTDESSTSDDITFETKRSKEVEREATAMRRKITWEISKLGSHHWAGEYYAGDGLGVNTTLVIAPEAGFVFEWCGCLGLYDRNFGSVRWTNNAIELSCVYPNSRKGFQGIATKLVPVSWGARSYLVPADDLVRFCNDINQGWEPRRGTYGFHLLRRGDETKQVKRSPNVPEQYRAHLLAKPIEAIITAVGSQTIHSDDADRTFKDTHVTLDAGANKGIRARMQLFVLDREAIAESINVVKVETDRSEGIVRQFGDREPKPRVGWRVSTRAPWNKSQAGD